MLCCQQIFKELWYSSSKCLYGFRPNDGFEECHINIRFVQKEICYYINYNNIAGSYSLFYLSFLYKYIGGVMKRINYDELIWFILLVILTFLMFFLIKSDEIQNFINGRMLIFFKFSVIILVLFSICQFPKIFNSK